MQVTTATHNKILTRETQLFSYEILMILYYDQQMMYRLNSNMQNTDNVYLLFFLD